MADKKFSELTALTTLDGTEEFALNDSATSKKMTASDLKFEITKWTEVSKGGDESVTSSTTLQDDDHLLFATTSGALYEIELYLIYASPVGGTAPDIKLSMGEDSTDRGVVLANHWSTADAATTTSAKSNITSTIAAGTGTGKRVVLVRGSHLGNGGNFKVQWAQNSSTGSATTVYTGSLLRYRKIV